MASFPPKQWWREGWGGGGIDGLMEPAEIFVVMWLFLK